MPFESDLEKFTVKLTDAVPLTVLPAFAAALHESIQVGSAETGAPGQPVQTGNLRASWQIIFPTPDTAEVVTNVEYAPFVEQGINRWGPVTYRVGGPHGVALTLASAQRVLDRVVKEAA